MNGTVVHRCAAPRAYMWPEEFSRLVDTPQTTLDRHTRVSSKRVAHGVRAETWR